LVTSNYASYLSPHFRKLSDDQLARIHAANLVNFGILPLTFKEEDVYAGIEPGDGLVIPGIRRIIDKGGTTVVRNTTKGIDFEVNCSLSRRQRDILLAGGALNLAKKRV
jgi:aconitate hydratase